MTRCAFGRPAGGVATAWLAVSLVAGCSAAPDLDGGVAIQLQQRVATAKQSAAGQDYRAALAELDQLGEEVAAAAGQGKLSEQRRARITAAISTIKTDLAAAAAPAPEPSAPVNQPLTEEQEELADEARKEAEERREEARKDAEEQRKKAQKEAEKQRGGG